MFADVAGSTRLYDILGNDQAEKRIANCIQGVSEITQKNNGRIIKTIGDEVMSCFRSADDATNTALQIQNQLGNSSGEGALQLRIGMHYGEAIEKDNDLFGDAVNVAARMAGVAKAKQIITTEYLVDELSERLAAHARLFDKAKVKGKIDELKIYQVNWEEESKVTKFATMHDMQKITSASVSVVLIFNQQEKLITDSDFSSAISIGRDGANITIDTNYASRLHADLDFRRGKFVLIDHSTNGTYVRFKGQDEVFIRREELPLMGEGYISLGEAIDENNLNIIKFNVLQVK